MITKLEIVCFMLALFLSSCGANDGINGAMGLPGNVGPSGTPGEPGSNGKDGTACYVTKINKKCYFKCTDGSWAYVGKDCGKD